MTLKPEGVSMNASPSSLSPHTIPQWQPDKLLKARDRVLILTGIEREFSAYLPWSEPQELFKVGIYDVATGKVGFARFGRDIAFAFVKAGLAPPWSGPQTVGVEIHRAGHPGENKGRQHTWATLIDLDPAVLAIAPLARRRLVSEGHYPNLPLGAWADLEERAKSELAIEAAALGMVGEFKASDIKKIVGDDKRISRVLRGLVREGRLEKVKSTGKKYIVTPPQIIERSDWTH